jgi:two-component system response regulator DevR
MIGDNRLRLVLVEDHPLVRVGLRALLERADDITVVGEATTIAEALIEVESTRPDVVVLDVRLPDGSGAEACRAIRAIAPSTRVLILSAFDDEVITAVLAGASGYVMKSTKLAELLEAVRVVGRGEAFLSPAVTSKLLEYLRTHTNSGSTRDEGGDDLLARLSEQELRILPLIAEGKTNREIGLALTLSEHTIKIHVSDLLNKLHLSRRSQAAALVGRHQAALSGYSRPRPVVGQ